MRGFAPYYLLVIGIGLTSALGAVGDPPGQVLTPEEALRAEPGSTITVRFRVAKAYGIWAAVPVGQEPSFGLKPERPDGETSNFSVLVSGQLVKDIKRLGVEPLKPGPFFIGRDLQVTGKLHRFEPQAGRKDAKPSYQLAVSRLEDFRILK
jgi:hypothetical protein